MKLYDADNPFMVLLSFILVVVVLVTMAGIALALLLGSWWCVAQLWGMVV